MADPFLGQIMLCPYTFPPYGWADCAGQLLLVNQYAALYSLLGTYYGGNGTSNFALPDLQGRTALSQGQLAGGANYAMGTTAGLEAVTLQLTEIAAHSHPLQASGAASSLRAPATAMLSHPAKLAGGGLYSVPPPNTTLSPAAIGPSGGNANHNTMQPYLVLRYIIALQGVFPQRS